eukprot:1150516-Pelagomonas_calceolata.AAC.3
MALPRTGVLCSVLAAQGKPKPLWGWPCTRAELVPIDPALLIGNPCTGRECMKGVMAAAQGHIDWEGLDEHRRCFGCMCAHVFTDEHIVLNRGVLPKIPTPEYAHNETRINTTNNCFWITAACCLHLNPGFAFDICLGVLWLDAW